MRDNGGSAHVYDNHVVGVLGIPPFNVHDLSDGSSQANGEGDLVVVVS